MGMGIMGSLSRANVLVAESLTGMRNSRVAGSGGILKSLLSVNAVFSVSRDMNLTHRWRKKVNTVVQGEKIAIQGRKIIWATSTLASEIKKDPRVLQRTYWNQSEVSSIPRCENLTPYM